MLGYILMRLLAHSFALFFLATVGLFISSFLLVTKIRGSIAPCGKSNGCAIIENSPISSLFGQPIALYGVVFYAFMIIVSIAYARPKIRLNQYLHVTGYTLAILGVAASLILTTYSFLALKTSCPWCIGSAVTCSLVLSHFAAKSETQKSPQRLPMPVLLIPVALTGMSFHIASNLPIKITSRAGDDLELSKVTLKELTKGHRIGPSDARLIIIMFSDLTCSACAQSHPMIKKLVETSPDTALVWKHFPLPGGRVNVEAAKLAEVASLRGKFWSFTDEVYRARTVNSTQLEVISSKFGLPRDPTSLSRVSLIVDEDRNLANRLKLTGTPSFVFIDGHAKPTFRWPKYILLKFEEIRSQNK